jgi:hypothetical protein
LPLNLSRIHRNQIVASPSLCCDGYHFTGADRMFVYQSCNLTVRLTYDGLFKDRRESRQHFIDNRVGNAF